MCHCCCLLVVVCCGSIIALCPGHGVIRCYCHHAPSSPCHPASSLHLAVRSSSCHVLVTSLLSLSHHCCPCHIIVVLITSLLSSSHRCCPHCVVAPHQWLTSAQRHLCLFVIVLGLSKVGWDECEMGGTHHGG